MRLNSLVTYRQLQMPFTNIRVICSITEGSQTVSPEVIFTTPLSRREGKNKDTWAEAVKSNISYIFNCTEDCTSQTSKLWIDSVLFTISWHSFRGASETKNVVDSLNRTLHMTEANVLKNISLYYSKPIKHWLFSENLLRVKPIPTGNPPQLTIK